MIYSVIGLGSVDFRGWGVGNMIFKSENTLWLLIFIFMLVIIISGVSIGFVTTQRETLEAKNPYLITVKQVDKGIEITQYNKKHKEIKVRILREGEDYILFIPAGAWNCEEWIKGKPIVEE